VRLTSVFGNDMKPLLKMLLVAAAHIGFLFSAYGTHFFGLHERAPYDLLMFLWLGASSAGAFCFYYFALARSPLLSSKQGRRLKLGACALVVTLVSLYLGVFWCFNTFGT
jgi:hypothetical protein